MLEPAEPAAQQPPGPARTRWAGTGYPVGTPGQLRFENRFARALAEKLLPHRPDGARCRPTRGAVRHTGSQAHSPAPATAGDRWPTSPAAPTAWYEARVGRAAVRVLEQLGFEVLVPEQNCCGLPLLSNGEFPAARRYHRRNIEKLIGLAERGLPIVGTSTSCTLTLKEEAPELLDAYRPRAGDAVAAATYDICEFLRAVIEER